MSTSHNRPEKSSTTKEYEHTPSGHSLFTQCSFDATKNKLDCHRDKDCMEKFCKDLKNMQQKWLTMKKKEMIPLANEKKSYIVNKKFVICEKKNLVLMMMIKSIIKP